jgi:transposase InsO family protein
VKTPAIPLPREWTDNVQRGWLCAIALAHRGMTFVRAWAENSPLPRVRLAGELAVVRAQLALVERENRLLRARFERVPAANRPHFTPAERLEILAIKSETGWTAAELARRFLVTPLTVARWLRRLDEGGESALLAMPAPVNRFPDFVAQLVRQLRAACPAMGKTRIAQLLARCGLHLAASTVERMLRDGPKPNPKTPVPAPSETNQLSGKTVVARHPNHVWGMDHSIVPTGLGFWVPWFPSAIIPVWPFCFWLSVVLDHFSRRVLAIGVFIKEPTAEQTCRLLDRARRRAGGAPSYTITDHGTQFQDEYRAWCERQGVKPRYGAIGKYGSIARVERFWRSLKSEAFGPGRRLVPLSLRAMLLLCNRYAAWYNVHRPHQGLVGCTPHEVFTRSRPAHLRPRLEPRARYPGDAPCAAPQTSIRGRRGGQLRLVVRHPPGLPHLPVLELRKAA